MVRKLLAVKIAIKLIAYSYKAYFPLFFSLAR